MIQNILFDFDGTLVDTNELVIYSLQDTYKTYLGRTLSSEELNSILGKPLVDQMKLFSCTHPMDMAEHYRRTYRHYQDSMIKEFPGIHNMLGDLKALGCRNAIVSAKGRSGIEHGIEHFGFEPYIDAIVSAYDVENNKPHPEPALKALALLGGTKENSILVGDSPYDILCGKNAGMLTVLVHWTIFPMVGLKKLEPDFIIDSPHELTKIVKSSYR